MLKELGNLLAVLPPGLRFVDCFAGVGLKQLKAVRPDFSWQGLELEAEWAAHDEDCICANAMDAPFDTGTIDGLVTSPAYGNRMADSYDGRDGTVRRSYRIQLGRPLSEGSGAGLHWGEAYWELHDRVYAEAVRYLKPGAVVLVNIKDHERQGRQRRVVEWHAEALENAGIEVLRRVPVKTPGFRNGANREARADVEMILVGRR